MNKSTNQFISKKLFISRNYKYKINIFKTNFTDILEKKSDKLKFFIAGTAFKKI